MAKIRRHRAGKESVRLPNPLPEPPPYHIYFADSAKAVYVDLAKKSSDAELKGDPTNSCCTTFRMVREAIKCIIPQSPVDRKYALSGTLSNIFRIKKGRYRICWIASTQHRIIFILFISESLRKDGDISDPYRLFTKMVMTGEFDSMFDQLGIRKPEVHPKIQ